MNNNSIKANNFAIQQAKPNRNSKIATLKKENY